MSQRKRLNLSMREETYNELQKVVEDYHFKNACEVVNTLIGLFLKRVRAAEDQDPPEEEDDDERYIAEMFSEFADWEPTPEPGHAPAIRRPRRRR